MKRHRLISIAVCLATMIVTRAAPPAALPGPGFPGDRYASLWTKSPFSIATPDAPPTSADYSLVGLAKFDGVSYVSLIDKQSQEHFVLSSDTPARNLTLVSITRNADGASAVIRRNDETLTLRQEQTAATPPGVSPPIAMAPMGMPNTGGAPSSVGGLVNPAYAFPPHVRAHRPPIRPPPRPQGEIQVPPPALSQPPPSSQPPPQTGR